MSIHLALAIGDDVRVHAATCADLRKRRTAMNAYNGIESQTFPDGTDERDVWLDYNADFLEEDKHYDDGSTGAWPLVFMPCCKQTGLKANSDRTP